MLRIEYRCDISLNPRPSTCGKMNHIQCEDFRPLRISRSACGKTPACAPRKRPRSCGSSPAADWLHSVMPASGLAIPPGPESHDLSDQVQRDRPVERKLQRTL